MLEQAKETTMGMVYLFAGILYAFGGFVGAVYWAINEDILFVVLSIFIPFFGGVSVLVDLLS